MKDLRDIAERVVELAAKRGAKEAACSASRGRFIELQYRDEKLEKVTESSSSGLGVDLYVDGRYSSHRTSDLRKEPLEQFVERAVAMTRLLTEDPHRGLADPKLYENRPDVDLEIYDPGYDQVSTESRKKTALAVEKAARSVDDAIISVTAGYYDVTGESVQVHSNGFLGERVATQFWTGAEVSVADADGKKPEDYFWAGARFHNDLPDPGSIGREAARRALARRGQRKLDSGRTTIVLENRIAGRLVRVLLGATKGAAIQQQRSFLIGKRGERIASELLTLSDDPLMPRGFGSRLFDGDGISARKRNIVENGVLKEYLIDVYYGRKLGEAPTGGGVANLTFPSGERNAEEIIASVDKGIYVTGILGGNADPTAGDFSHGIVGFEIRGGELNGAVGEMNITGTHRELWNRLTELGNDPYPFSPMRSPTLVFEDVAVSGN